MIHIENTTIEEQIAYEKDFAKFCLEQAEKWKNKDLDEYGYHMKTYRESTNKYRWLEELQSHREAWEKVRTELKQEYERFPNRSNFASGYIEGIREALYKTGKYRPKEGDAE